MRGKSPLERHAHASHKRKNCFLKRSCIKSGSLGFSSLGSVLDACSDNPNSSPLLSNRLLPKIGGILRGAFHVRDENSEKHKEGRKRRKRPRHVVMHFRQRGERKRVRERYASVDKARKVGEGTRQASKQAIVCVHLCFPLLSSAGEGGVKMSPSEKERNLPLSPSLSPRARQARTEGGGRRRLCFGT